MYSKINLQAMSLPQVFLKLEKYESVGQDLIHQEKMAPEHKKNPFKY